MVLLLFVQALHLVKKPAIPDGPPENMLVEQTLFGEVDHTNEVADLEIEEEVEHEMDYREMEEETIIEEQIIDPTNSDSPPLVVENPVIADGFEWIEWPTGSGQNYFRAESSEEEWKRWPVE